MTESSTRARSGAVADKAVRRAMFASLLRIRMVEEEIARRYSEQEMRCPTHLCTGQEGAPAGVSAHLTRNDHVFSMHRSHGHYLAKGGDLDGMIAEIYGKATGCAGGKGGSQHLIDTGCGFMGSAPILASTIPVGVGAAWGSVMRGEPRVVVIYFGDGATEEGAFHEAMNFAGVRKLPVVFVCENNLYSVHSTLEVRQPTSRTIAQMGPMHGMEGLSGDGNDVDEVWRLAGDAVEKARQGGGPTILELFTYRWLEHCGPMEDIKLNYRSQEEFDAWLARDPVAQYRRRMIADGVLTAPDVEAIARDIAAEIERAFAHAKAGPFPLPAALTEHVYPEPVR